jgi:hypothetical protein
MNKIFSGGEDDDSIKGLVASEMELGGGVPSVGETGS